MACANIEIQLHTDKYPNPRVTIISHNYLKLACKATFEREDSCISGHRFKENVSINVHVSYMSFQRITFSEIIFPPRINLSSGIVFRIVLSKDCIMKRCS